MPKEKSITELRGENKTLHERGAAIIEVAKKENRTLNDAENREINEIQLQIEQNNLDIALQRGRNQQTAAAEAAPNGFSLRKAILEMVDGKGFSEQTRQADTAGAMLFEGSGVTRAAGRGISVPVETRASFTATGEAGTGSDLIQTNFLDILPPLRDRLVLSQAGATMLTGLRGNIDIPAYSGATAFWVGENDPAPDGGGKFSHKTMAPKRLTSKLLVSRQLLIQDTLGAEQLLRRDLVDAVGSKLEATILGGAEHTDKKPDGLFTGFTGEPVAMDWGTLVDMETAVDLDNALADNSCYIFHTSLYGKGKKTPKKAQGVLGFIVEADKSVNGYRALRTNAIYTNASVTGEGAVTPATAWGAVFGNWSDLLIGQWGALDLIVDPLTRAEDAFIKIIVHSYWDVVSRRDVSFSKALLK